MPAGTITVQCKWTCVQHRAVLTLKVSSLFPTVVYPSLESDEDNPVFKSRSKKRKSSDDAPYSPTGKSIKSVLPRLRLSQAGT